MKAQYVLCKEDKRPVNAGWNKIDVTREQVEAHLAKGGLIGLIPGSINCMVIDIDTYDDDTIEPIYDALENPFMYESPKGYHIWVRIPSNRPPITNRQWKHNNGIGDIRGDNGYVVLWCERDELKEWFTGKPAVNDPGKVLEAVAVSYTHLTLPTTPYV